MGSQVGHLNFFEVPSIRFVLRVRKALRFFSIANTPVQPAFIKPSESPPQPANTSMKHSVVCLLILEGRRFIWNSILILAFVPYFSQLLLHIAQMLKIFLPDRVWCALRVTDTLDAILQALQKNCDFGASEYHRSFSPFHQRSPVLSRH